MDTVTFLDHDVTAIVPIINVLLLLIIAKVSGKNSADARDAALQSAIEATSTRADVKNGIGDKLDHISESVDDLRSRVEELETARETRDRSNPKNR